jgi:hypothetical protein
MQVKTRLAVLILAALTVRASDASGCFAGPQSPAHLLKEAEVIVRVRAASAEPLSLGESRVRFVVLEQLKGPHQFDVAVRGKLTEHADMNPGPVPYAFIRRSGRGGGCYALEYQQNGEFLLFLKKAEGVLTPYWAPLSATHEQIAGPQDPWVIWVKEELARAEKAGK